MKQILILLSLTLFFLCFVKGSRGIPSDGSAVAKLNQAVDAQLAQRLEMLALGAELSAAWVGR